jgi:hypothetical protein
MHLVFRYAEPTVSECAREWSSCSLLSSLYIYGATMTVDIYPRSLLGCTNGVVEETNRDIDGIGVGFGHVSLQSNSKADRY